MAPWGKAIAFVAAVLSSACSAVEPAAIYDGGFSGGAPIKLSIANGGAGQSGLVKELADAFIKERVSQGSEPFRVAWYKSDTTYSIQYLKDGTADVAITYNQAAEEIAIHQGTATSTRYYAFRDHFLLVGPPSNPANVSEAATILEIFAQLYEAAEGSATEPPVRFLSRYDKSATNIKETTLWASIGQVPWATAYSTWYHQYIAFPIQALTAAILLQEYTITDRGTILSLDGDLKNQTVIYKAGSDDADDLLLNPAHLLIGEHAPNPEEALEFAEWVVGEEGQDVIVGFKKNGEQLYSPAPSKLKTARFELVWQAGMHRAT